MAAKALRLLKNVKQFTKFSFSRFAKATPKAFENKLSTVPPPSFDKAAWKILKPTPQSRNLVWNLARSLFRHPQVFRRGPITPIRLGFCIGLAISYKDPQEFGRINNIANNYLQSAAYQKKKWNLSSVSQFEIGPFLTAGCEGAVYAVRPSGISAQDESAECDVSQDWMMAMKMHFNYTEKEHRNETDEEIVEKLKAAAIPHQYLPPHPSIAEHHAMFVDQFQPFPEADSHFPIALPPSLNSNPDSCGGEKTLFSIMSKYSSSLYDRLKEGPLSQEEAIHVLLQLIEGDVHLKRCGIAHRDLSSKNILVDYCSCGLLKACITDFGCATDRLTEASSGMLSLKTCPGIPVLQAPEVANFDSDRPLDYRKADLWSLATLVYDMYKPGSNPFTKENGLDSRSYRDSDLPPVENAPQWINRLVHEMLRKNPNDRPSSELCANIIQMMSLGIPMKWIMIDEEPSLQEFREWLDEKFPRLIMSHRKNHMVPLHLIFYTRITEKMVGKQFKNCIYWLRELLKSRE